MSELLRKSSDMASDKNKNSDFFEGRLAGLMESRGLTKAETARVLNVSNAHIANWLNGQLPRADQVLNIARYFGVRMEWLLTGESGRTVDEVLEKAGKFFGEDLSDEQSRRAVEAADEYLAAKRNAERLEKAAACAEDLGKALRAAQAELERLRKLLG